MGEFNTAFDDPAPVWGFECEFYQASRDNRWQLEEIPGNDKLEGHESMKSSSTDRTEKDLNTPERIIFHRAEMFADLNDHVKGMRIYHGYCVRAF
jgi:hypothetical protein